VRELLQVALRFIQSFATSETRRRPLGAGPPRTERAHSGSAPPRSPIKLLERWGVVFRDLLARETLPLTWRDLRRAVSRSDPSVELNLAGIIRSRPGFSAGAFVFGGGVFRRVRWLVTLCV
jgi:hypothetical protein